MTTNASMGTVTQKTSAEGTSMVNAIIIAPKTMMGLLSRSLRDILIPVCTWLISEVMRVISVEVPFLSTSDASIPIIREKSLLLRVPDTPTAAFAAKYCAVIATISPAAASSTSTAPFPKISLLSPPAMPLSMISAITRGTNSSKHASVNLKKGAKNASFL